ncbi:MAG TPA: SWIM zinc finger family protein [Roseiflexaceae bacterium]|jgi:uncharacterized Zn finger protein|nr:SWIM zinc finger family protein [Roseiflexaceae bacterium]
MKSFDQISEPLQRSVVNVKRLQRASKRLMVVPVDPEHGRYLVESATQPGEMYEVRLADDELRGECSCPWGQHGGVNCKHVLAALQEHYADEGRLSFWRSKSEARRQHRQIVSGEQLFATLRRAS